jgi:hypothetical protein
VRWFEMQETVKVDSIKNKLGWVKQIKMLESKGYLIRYVYDGEEFDVPKGELDSECQSFIPKIPDKVLVYSYVPDKGFVKVTEFEGKNTSVDPTPEEAMEIWKNFLE